MRRLEGRFFIRRPRWHTALLIIMSAMLAIPCQACTEGIRAEHSVQPAARHLSTPAPEGSSLPSIGSGPADLRSNQLDCPRAATLESLAVCIEAQLPDTSRVHFSEPSLTIRTAWRSAVLSMMSGVCDAALLPGPLKEAYSLARFLDDDSGEAYCVLRESQDTDRDHRTDLGWGTFIVSLHPKRQLGIMVPHPVDEPGTLSEGARIFGETGAWYLLVAGTHRNAGGSAGTCQPAFDRADVTHNVDNLFQAAAEEISLIAAQPDSRLVTLQFHGMAPASCPGVDIVLSNGTAASSATSQALWDLRDGLHARRLDWVVEVTGDASTCGMEGTLNVQGRLLNGVPPVAVCEVPAAGPTGRFIHIEQKPTARDAPLWIEAIRETFAETAR